MRVTFPFSAAVPHNTRAPILLYLCIIILLLYTIPASIVNNIETPQTRLVGGQWFIFYLFRFIIIIVIICSSWRVWHYCAAKQPQFPKMPFKRTEICILRRDFFFFYSRVRRVTRKRIGLNPNHILIAEPYILLLSCETRWTTGAQFHEPHFV